MTLRELLSYEPVELTFGTSGLRGLVMAMTDLECYINTAGFLKFLEVTTGLEQGAAVYLAGDLRDSTPRIMRAAQQAILDHGYSVVYCGFVPTPSLSLASLSAKAPGVMVTGSHIPADRNGIKFVKPDTEVLKRDEAGIKTAVTGVRSELYGQDATISIFDGNGMLKAPLSLPEVDETAATAYHNRYVSVFSDRPLSGKKIVFYQHSAVGRDALPKILEALGAEVVLVGKSEVFIPIDTENVTPANEAYFTKLASQNPGLFAIVSTDGDSDRPFVIDEHGVFHRGDVLGLVVANWLQADSAAYPITTSDAVDTALESQSITYAHTKIGSPYVIEAMQAATAAGSVRPVGWEVNGGFLIGSDLLVNDKPLKALATRDALIAILGALLTASDTGITVSEVFARLPQRFSQAGLIDNIAPAITKDLLAPFNNDTPESRVQLSKLLLPSEVDRIVVETSTLDGLRVMFDNGDVVHLRSSGNAPQLRIYTLADSQARADELISVVRTSIQSRI